MLNDDESEDRSEKDSSLENSLNRIDPGQEGSNTTDPEMGKVGEMVARIFSLTKEESFKAPYPPPQYIKLYNQVSPGLGDKIMSEFFAESEFRRNETKEQRKDSHRRVRESNVIVVLVTALFLTCAAYALYLDHATSAVLIASVPLVCIAILVVTRRSESVEKIMSKFLESPNRPKE